MTAHSPPYGNAYTLIDEQSALFAKQRRTNEALFSIQAKLDANAAACLELAQRVSTDYSLGKERVPLCCKLYEAALKSKPTEERHFIYALFLQQNELPQRAEQQYHWAMELQRSLVKTDATRYQPLIASTLNNLALLVSQDAQRRNEVESLYREALELRTALAKDDPVNYNASLAITLSGYGRASIMYGNIDFARSLLIDASALFKSLASDDPHAFADVYLTSLALLETALCTDSSSLLLLGN